MNEKAELLFTEIWLRTNSRFADVDSFRIYTTHALPHVKKTVDLQYSSFTQSLAYDDNYEKFFKDKSGFFESVGGVENLSGLLSDKQIESYRKAIDSSSIILAHSALDAAAFDYFSVVEIIAPIQDFEKFVIKKQISLNDLKGSSYDELVKQKIHKFIMELERGSLLEKIDKLFQICQPPPKFEPIRNHVYNRDKIETLDNLRHEIVHGRGSDSPLHNCAEDIKYMRDTANFLMALVHEKYSVKINPTILKESLLEKSRTSF
jgi:hypothetical protein